VTAPLDLEGIKASIGKPLEHSVLIHGSPRTMPDWRASLALADRDRAALLAEVERLTRVLTALVDDSEGQQHRVAWQDACEVLHGHRGPEVG